MEIADTVSEQSRLHALARSMMYGRLAVGFRYPDKPVFLAATNPQVFDEFQLGCTVLQCGDCIIHLTKLRSARPAAHSDLEAAYLSAFRSVQGNSPICPLNEGDYRTDVPRGHLLVELKALYLGFDLIISEDDIDLPDRLGAELEFMHFLTLKQAEALDAGEDPAAYVKAQHDFLADHMQQWIPEMAARARECTSAPFYQHWIALTATFVNHDAIASEGHRCS